MAPSPLALSFVTSAAEVGQLPATRGEVAVVGRSNVGKSSLINALANRAKLAKTSKTPGRTQLLNLFALPDGTSVLDLPGYGFAQVPGAVRAKWPAMIEGYLLGREGLRAVVALVDAEVGPTANDIETLAWLRTHDLPVRIVATKVDKVKPSKLAERKRDLASGCLVTVADVAWVSSAKGVGIDDLRSRFLEWVRPEAHEAVGGAAEVVAPAAPKRDGGPAGPGDGDDDGDDEWADTRIGG